MSSMRQTTPFGNDGEHTDTAFDWYAVKEMTPEELKRVAEFAPDHLKAQFLALANADPGTRRAEYEARKAEAEAKQLSDALEFQREASKAAEADLKRSENELNREKVRKGIETSDGYRVPRKLVGRPLNTVQARAVKWLWTGWIAKRYINLLAGETGAGKSTVLADIVARVTTGTPWPGEFHAQSGENAMHPQPTRAPARVLWLGSEDGIDDMTVPRLMACGANLANVIEIQGAQQGGQRNTFSLQDDLKAVDEWLTFAAHEDNPFAMLVIDPVTSYLPGQKLRKVDLADAGQLRTVLEPWMDLAQKHNLAIVCVTHFAKDTTRSMLHRVLGSGAFAATCRSLLAVAEPPSTDEDEPGAHERVMVQIKTNLPDHPGGAWRFHTERVEVGYDPDDHTPIGATRVEWEKLDTVLTPQAFMGPKRGPKSQYEMPFAMWLQTYFAARSDNEWLRVDLVRMAAMAEKVTTPSWWEKNSAVYLEKKNEGGFWFCRPKQQTHP